MLPPTKLKGFKAEALDGCMSNNFWHPEQPGMVRFSCLEEFKGRSQVVEPGGHNDTH